LMRRLSQLQAQHPRLTVDVLSGNAALDLARHEADLAIRFAETTQPDLIRRRLCDMAWSLYASADYLARVDVSAAPANLAGHDVIGFDPTMAGNPGALWLEDHLEGARVVVRCNSLVAALNAATVGMGIAVLPCFLADREPPLHRLTDQVVATRPIW